MVKYTLARLGLFVAVAAILVVAPIPVSLLLKLAVAILVSAVLSFVLLRGLRDQVADQLAAASTRRTARKAELRAALAGDDAPPPASSDAP